MDEQLKRKIAMKKFKSALILLSAVAFSQSHADDYIIRSTDTTYGATRFQGTNVQNYTSNIEIPSSGLTSEDNLLVYGYYDINNGTNISVNRFTYVSNGLYTNSFSFYSGSGSTVIQAREIMFLLQPDNNVAYDYTKGINAEDLTDLSGLSNLPNFRVNNSTVTLRGEIVNSNTLDIHIGSSYVLGQSSLTLESYDENSTAEYSIGTVYFNYSEQGADSSGILTVGRGLTLNVDNITFSTSYSEGATASSTLNIVNGGRLNLGAVKFGYDSDVVTINHLDGVLGVGSSSNLDISTGDRPATLNYVLGENSIFDTTNGNIYIESSVNLSSASGVNGGMLVRGGGELNILTSVEAVTGKVHVTGGSILYSDNGWFVNAQSVQVDAGSRLGFTGDMILNADSQITIGVDSESVFGQIVNTGTILSEDGSYGSLYFILGADAFENTDSITIGLNSIIGDSSFTDWDSFDISTNMGEYYIQDGNITFVVPEPAEWAALFGAVALGVAAWRRRRAGR